MMKLLLVNRIRIRNSFLIEEKKYILKKKKKQMYLWLRSTVPGIIVLLP